MEIAIRQCRSSGIDCKVHGLTIEGRQRADDDDVAANFTFLASDNEEDEEANNVARQTSATRLFARKQKTQGTKDIQTHVFVWGLNDKDQLGGPKGSKVGELRAQSNPHYVL